MAAAGSIISLSAPEAIYGKETSSLFDAGVAQDLVNLFLVSPMLIILTVLAARGWRRAWLCVTGVLAFTAYNYAIYAFSIHFGPLFLVWVGVLGLAVFALIGALAALAVPDPSASSADAAVRLPGWFLIATVLLFAVLWLSEIVPDLLAGQPSASAASWNVPTNPVHVLDLAIFLPASCASGALLLRRNPVGYATAPGVLLFLALTCLPIIVTPFVAGARGDVPGWAVVLPIGVIGIATIGVLWRFLLRLGPSSHR